MRHVEKPLSFLSAMPCPYRCIVTASCRVGIIAYHRRSTRWVLWRSYSHVMCFTNFFSKNLEIFFQTFWFFFFFHKTHKKNKKVVKHVRFYLIVFTRHLMALTRITYPMAMIKRWLCYDACNDDEVIALSGGHHEFLRALCVLTDQHRQN